jgi:uncharacterized protein (TIRG00374 family)
VIRGRDLAFLILGLAVLGGLLWKFGTQDLVTTLAQVRPGRLCVYLVLTAVVVLGHSLRWRLVAHSLGADPPLGVLVRARLAGDAVGALVPSGKVAGEPVRFALVRSHCVDGPLTAAAVAIDRILEALGNLACVLVYGAIFAQAHAARLQGSGPWLVVVTAALFLAGIAALLAGARRGFRPLGFLYGARARRRFPHLAHWADKFEQTETHLLRFFQHHPRACAQGLLASLCIEALVVAEFYMLFTAFDIHLELPTMLMALVTSGLVRAVPTPGGIGALEAGQVALLQMSSGQAQLGFVVGIVMRLHEMLMITAGFLALALHGVLPGQAKRLVQSTQVPER